MEAAMAVLMGFRFQVSGVSLQRFRAFRFQISKCGFRIENHHNLEILNED